MVRCSACQADSPAGTLFCVACGLPLGAGAPVAVEAARSVRLVELANLVPSGLGLALPDTAWEGAIFVGRNDLAGGTVVDLDLTVHGGREKGVSRRHARLEYQAGTLRVADWESAHGTYVNKRRLAAGEAAMVADGDEIRLAEMVFRLEVR